MAKYPILDEASLPDDYITLDQWALEVDRTPATVRNDWRGREGFPAPVGQLRPRGRNGGGLGRHVFSRTVLNEFRAGQPDMWPEAQNIPVHTDRDPNERVTQYHFAVNVAKVDPKTVYQSRFLPARGADGRYRLGDLVEHWNNRPGRGLGGRRARTAA
jgi:hypothetical protein